MRKNHKERRPIIAAVDFSASSRKALLWAAKAAQCSGAPLIVLHVVHDPGAAPGYYQRVKKAKKHIHRIEDAAQEMMDQFLAETRRKHPGLAPLKTMETLLVVGLPVNRVLEVADTRDACQIVLGSRGRAGLPALLLGSKALRVAQLAEVPVTIVKGDREEP